MNIDLERLGRVGLTPALAERAERVLACVEAPAGVAASWRLGRITAVHRETLQWHDGVEERLARPRPRLVRDLAGDDTSLAVGDWGWLAVVPDGEAWLHALVPRSTHIVRRDGDGSRHAVVSNVDTVIVVMGLDDDFNLRRLERYLAIAHGSGAEAVVALTKADIAAADPARRDARLAALERRFASSLATVVVDATDAASAVSFARWLVAGRTLVLLGSSGAGKSTLTNTLLGRPVQDTGPVRAHDSRGMHTTTTRTLHLVPGGACIVDTPGVRTLRADVDEATLAASFADVADHASRCRFRDCSHAGEPGCAVRAEVDPDRLRNFQKLVRETRRDNLSWIDRRQQLAVWKSRGKSARVRLKMKRGEL